LLCGTECPRHGQQGFSEGWKQEEVSARQKNKAKTMQEKKLSK
jgi:hypothetical protein